MLIKKALKTLILKTLLTVATLNVAAASFALASLLVTPFLPLCLNVVGGLQVERPLSERLILTPDKAPSKSKIELSIENEIDIRDSKYLKLKGMTSDGQLAGYLEVRFDSPTEIHIVKMHTEDNFRRQGVSEELLQQLLKKSGQNVVISTFLEGTNREVFVEKFQELSNPKNPGYRTDQTNAERQLMALQQTPAYKIRKSLGMGKIVKMEIDDCTALNCRHPQIYLWVTKSN